MHCTACHEPADQHLCPPCTRALRYALQDLPRTLPLLQTVLIPAGRSALIGSRGAAWAPTPVDLRVLALLGPGNALPPDTPEGGGEIPILAMLTGWAHWIASQHPSAARDHHGTIRIQPCTAAHPRHGATVPGWCTWLRAYLPYTATRPWAGEMHQQITGLLAHIRHLTGAVARRHPKAAPCPHCDDFALAEVDGQAGITCEACGARLSTAEYAAHSAAILTTHQAA
jgi:hypothetical protein